NPVITSVVVPLITLFVGVVLGNGGFSQWKQTTINQQQHELEKTQKIVGLLNEIQTNMSKVVEFYKKDADLRRELGNKSTDADKSYLNSQIANIWEYEIPTIENTIIRLESRLAKLEDREPKSKS